VLAHLAAGLAHEIRNPLHAIGINAGVVEQYVGRDPSERNQRSMRESLVSIRDETRRLGELLNNYLGLVRPNSSEHTVDLHDLCRRIVRLLGYTAAQAEVRLRLDGEGGLPPVQGSADRLQQAILNLVLNAVQAMPRGGEVVVATASQSGTVTVTVTDNGPGVPEELRGSLFYFGATGRAGGTGLGLPIVRLIAEHHGGSIAYDPAPGHGARFTLTLPVQPVTRPLTPTGRR
jgi:signal transduction histidine kinase